MDKNWEFAGIFWPPNQQKNFQSGFLAYSPENGLKLRLIGSKVASTPWTEESLNNYSILHGHLVQRGAVTIYGSLAMTFNRDLDTSTRVGLEGFEHLEFQFTHITPYCVYLGILADGPESIIFDRIDLKLTNFNHWLDRFKIKFNPDFSKSDQQLTFSKDEALEFRITTLETTLIIETAWKYNPKSIGKKGRSDEPDGVISHSDIIRLYPDRPQNLLWFQKNYRILRQFLTLCMQKSVYLNSMEGVQKNQIDSKKEKKVSIFFEQPGWDSEIQCYPDDMILRYRDIASTLPEIFNRFFESYENMKSIYALLLKEQTNPNSSLINRFLNICQALESYHAQLHPQDKLIPKPLYKQLVHKPIKNLLETIQIPNLEPSIYQEIKEKILNNVGLANGPNLTTRLTQLLETVCPDKIGIPDAPYFALRVSKTRNFYTHYSDDSQILTQEQIAVAYRQLKLLLLWLIFRDWGLEEDQYFRNLEHSNIYQYMAWRQDLIAKPPSTQLVKEDCSS